MSYRKFAYVYDELMEDMPYPEWLRFVREVWDKYGMPRQVAELGCGTGSITIPLVNAGFQLTGIDLSSDMLSVARDKMESTPQGHRLFQDGSVQWICQNMTSWELPEQVDSVISFCDCLNYLTEPEDIVQTFQATFAGLKPGGTFVFDVHHPNTLRHYDEEQPFMLDERSIAYLWTCAYDAVRTEIEHHLTIFAQTDEEHPGLYERFEETHIQRSYEQEWLTTELYKAGFRDVKCYADFQWNEPDENAARLFFIAVK